MWCLSDSDTYRGYVEFAEALWEMEMQYLYKYMQKTGRVDAADAMIGSKSGDGSLFRTAGSPFASSCAIDNGPPRHDATAP